MLYQNILGEHAPYQAFVGTMSGFPAHRHADLEFSYCLSGKFSVLLDRTPHTVRAGELLLVAPMVLHEIPTSHDPDRRVLTVVLGPSLLREDFAPFSGTAFERAVLSPAALGGDGLKAALDRVAALTGSTAHADRLALTGALFSIASHLATALTRETPSESRTDLRGVAGIEPALEMIWHGYRAPINIDMAAAATGYGKSNFCKIFKTVTGESFHSALNRRRVRVACDLLRGTNLPIADVGVEVGIPEPKTFSRVFRSIEGITPGEYRKQARGENRK